MKLKNISAEDFAKHHPGGQLGARLLLLVGDVMRKEEQNPVIQIHQPVKEMIMSITGFRVGAISVVDEGNKLIGLVTDYDIRRSIRIVSKYLFNENRRNHERVAGMDLRRL